MGEHTGRVLVGQLDIRDQRDTRVQPFEQVVREQRILGDHAGQRRVESIDVVETLAGEDALAKQILIGVRDGGGVRIDAGVTRNRVGRRANRPRSRTSR